MNYVVHVSSTMWEIKNQPSNSTSFSDNALHLLLLVAGILYRGLQVTSSFAIWGCFLKGCFERGIFWRATLYFEGHWRLQSWTPLGSTEPSNVHLVLVRRGLNVGNPRGPCPFSVMCPMNTWMPCHLLSCHVIHDGDSVLNVSVLKCLCCAWAWRVLLCWRLWGGSRTLWFLPVCSQSSIGDRQQTG